ncbi:ESPR domain-containing protein, partial [Achromobacter xylosoxidans]
MNHIYRLVWNIVSQSWVPVSEATRARGKSRGLKAGAVVGSVLLLSLMGMSFTQTAVAQSLQLCNGANGWAYGTGSTSRLNCGGEVTFSLHGSGTATDGGGGYGESTTYVRGTTNGTLV